MQPRLAKKIVIRVQEGQATAKSYRRDQVEAAFRVLKQPLHPDLLKPWTEGKVQDDPAALAFRQAENRRRRDESDARRQNKESRHRIAIEQAQLRERALTTARAAFQQAMTNDSAVVPSPDVAIAEHVQETVAPEMVTFDSVVWDQYTVTDLKQMVKDKGGKGYSALKRDELIALLTSG